MQPKSVLIMRHAEKSGDPMDPNLTEAGFSRARALAKWLPTICPQIDFLFATSISKHSNRPFETIRSLSKKIGVPIDATFADQDYGALADEILTGNRYSDKLIVISWHHGNIPPLCDALHAVAGQYPDPWDPAVFNLVLRLDYGANGVPATEQIVEPF